MKVLVVGADHLGSITDKLKTMGMDVEHITGRQAIDKRACQIASTTSLVLILVDYINHNTMKQVKRLARTRSIPMVFAPRRWTAISEKLTANGFLASQL